MSISAIDLFCGIGGLTHGAIRSGIRVIAGIDIDETCRFAYEKNNNSIFINKNINEVSGEEINAMYPPDDIRVLLGCAPCQPFSNYTNKLKNRTEDEKWGLLYSFSRIIKESMPEIISMENVPQLQSKQIFSDFVKTLEELGYFVSWKSVYCPDYGIPQSRRRLVLLASKFGNIQIIPPTHTPENYVTVRDVIGNLEKIVDGEVSVKDTIHRARKFTEINKKRIKQSKPGGTWMDWDPELLAACHRKDSGKSFKSVYARMEWDKPSPTITTQFYGYGNGRFGHPEQDRALSLREGALLQTFPIDYDFADPNRVISFDVLGRHIGNAVPVKLGEVIGISIQKHLEEINRGQ
ncbi:DNA cytosine methyltransferase [Brevibacillus sp. NSP2.1]|uniref:DNA cytosine methyltransferase n=1 Tax=Brevibacillus sp. NSP2.1 TaxID=3003229 RepID=UPI0004124900|nr:DNA cytosine methyltransferase [Brevibacillus sp. NSP2.1]QHZ55833.1 DNA cytosine methyltransferase [Brevibacillus sp. NSP2.1]